VPPPTIILLEIVLFINELSHDMNLGMKVNRKMPVPESWRSRLRPLGLGAASIGNLYEPVAETVAIDAIAAALGAGIRYIDTAPAEFWHALRQDGLLPPEAPTPDQGVAA
jgi:hypothetical protein